MRFILRLLPFHNFSEIMLKEAVLKAEYIVRFYYIALFFLAVTTIGDWSYYLDKSAIDPLWPIVWVNFVDYNFGVNIIFTTLLIGTFSAALFPKMRLTRLAAFLVLFEFVAFDKSFGQLAHNWHAFVLTSFLLVFLPYKREGDKSYNHNFLSIFWCCQAIVLLAYTMSGVWKIYNGFIQMALGEIHNFHPQAMNYQVADRLLQTGRTTLLDSFIIEQIWVGWPLYVGAIFIELLAFSVAFLPSFHRLWAFAVISMHICIKLTMGIGFEQNILLIALLFFNSPFIVSGNRWQNWLSKKLNF